MAFTFFFRDSETLELAIDHAVPKLAGQAFIRVWDAGCAHGPEPYTTAILLRERMSDYVFRNVTIHATDIDANFAARVTSGVYPEQEVKRIPADYLKKYFRPASTPGFVEVVPELRAKMTFTHHDLLSLQPIRTGLSLIVCKNVLLHFDEGQRLQVLRMFHEALRPDGLLVMEHTQKMPKALERHFQPAVPHAQVYRRLDPSFVEHPAETVAPHCLRGRPADEKGLVPAFSPGRTPFEQVG